MERGDRIEWDRINRYTGEVVRTEHGKVTGIEKTGPRIAWGWYSAVFYWSDVDRALADREMRVVGPSTLFVSASTNEP